MHCPKCGHENAADAKFCEECATPLLRSCNACGKPLSATAKFCPECGTPVAAVESPSDSPASPAAYTPKHLAEKIINSRSAIEGERKLVTILFADVKGSMELIADRDPEDARQILDPVLSLMMEAIHYYEGTVSLVMGDGVMAIFGAPVAHEDHAVRACYAALRLQELARKQAELALQRYGVAIQVRIGVNSGDVVVRSVGSDLHMDYTAVGQTTHLAARMEQMAESGAIFITPATMHLVKDYVTIKSVGSHPVKGLDEPVEIFEIISASTVRSRLQAAVARGLTAFTGREVELGLIERSLAWAKEGHGQVVALVGEAGIGKSRLLWEFTHSHLIDDWLVLEGSSSVYGKATSYGPVIDLLKSYLRIEDGEETDEIRERVTEKILSLDSSMDPLLPGIMSLLNIPPEGGVAEALDPQQRRRRMLDGLRLLLVLESRNQPLLLLFDDLHWCDEDTLALLDGLVDSLPTARILLLVCYRPEFEHSWSRKTYYREVRIDPLTPARTDELLDTLLGPDPIMRPLKQLLIERTDGNPFFLEESVKTLVEMDFLDGNPGAYRLMKAAETVRIPESARAILSARIDRLSEADKRILQAAAVIGKDVPFNLLSAITENDEDRLRDSLAHLQASEFLYEANLFPELKYTFRHALVQEVSYGMLLKEKRRSLHAMIVETSERSFADRPPQTVDRLAYHALHGEMWDRAVSYGRQAGKMALARTAFREAAGYFDDALMALRNLDADDQTRELTIDLRFDLRSALMPLGELERALEVLREAETLAAEIGDRRRLGLTSCYLTNLYWELGAQDQAIDAGRRAEEIATALDDEGMRNSVQRYLGRSHQAVGDYRRAIDLLNRHVESSGQATQPMTSSQVLTRLFLMISQTEMGAFAEAIACGEETIRQAEQLDNPFSHSAALSTLGRVYVRKGDFERSVTLLEQAVEISEEANIPLLFPFGAAPLGAAYARLGKIPEALTLLERAVERAAEMNRMVDYSLWFYWRSQALMLAGDRDAGRRLAERGLELSIAYKERGYQAWLLRVLGDIHAEAGAGGFDRAEAHYRQCLALAGELEMRPLLARCQISLATLFEKTDRHDEARSAVSAAQALCRDMEMTHWLRESESIITRLTSAAGEP